MLHSASRSLTAIGALAGSAIACGTEAPLETAALRPRIVLTSVAPNPHNVLSTLITFTAEHADSARVVYRDDRLALDSTPFVRVTGGPDTIVGLGLRPETTYRIVLEVGGPAGWMGSDTLAYRTGPLPEPLDRISINTSGLGGGGLSLTSITVPNDGVVALAFDSAGTIRWYRRFGGAERFPGELKQQPQGNFTLYRGSSTGVERVAGHYIEFTPSGDSVRAITVAPPRYLDNHDLWITRAPDGLERFHFFTYDHQASDLRPIGGPADVVLAGHQLVRLRADGSIEFEWNAWDHVSFDEWIEPNRLEPHDSVGRDFDHPNSLAFDRDGNYIVSFRRLGQVMKIDAATGAVIWRVGGRKSDVTFPDDALGGFSAQHSASILPDGKLLLYDNGNQHEPPETRAVEYSLDFSSRSARLVWEFRHAPSIFTQAVGSTQRLPNGNTLIGYGWIGYAAEVGDDRSVTWTATLSVDGQATRFYRLNRIASLYGARSP